MDQDKDFPGPSPDDYSNVLALNTAFIEATSDLKGPQRGRLAAAPFLLFSFRENDLQWWTSVLADSHQGDLMATALVSPAHLRGIQTAGLSFLWHLALRNPYAARIISGASVSWCEKITSLPLVTLLNRISSCPDLMVSRLETPTAIGERLLDSGTSSRRKIRKSSHFSAWQTLLTRTGAERSSRLPAAACRMNAPLRVLEKK